LATLSCKNHWGSEEDVRMAMSLFDGVHETLPWLSGVAASGWMVEMPLKHIQRAFDVNVFGALRVAQVCLQLMYCGHVTVTYVSKSNLPNTLKVTSREFNQSCSNSFDFQESKAVSTRNIGTLRLYAARERVWEKALPVQLPH